MACKSFMHLKKILESFLFFAGEMNKDREGESNFSSSKEMNSIFQEGSVPCPLSSSLYYGGQEDMYIQSSSPHTSGSYTNVSFNV